MKKEHLKEIEKEIEKLESCETITLATCSKLADLYAVLDHAKAKELITPVQKEIEKGTEYQINVRKSARTEKPEIEEASTLGEDSYFLTIVKQLGRDKAIKVMDLYLKQLRTKSPIQYTNIIDTFKKYC